MLSYMAYSSFYHHIFGWCLYLIKKPFFLFHLFGFRNDLVVRTTSHLSKLKKKLMLLGNLGIHYRAKMKESTVTWEWKHEKPLSNQNSSSFQTLSEVACLPVSHFSISGLVFLFLFFFSAPLHHPPSTTPTPVSLALQTLLPTSLIISCDSSDSQWRLTRVSGVSNIPGKEAGPEWVARVIVAQSVWPGDWCHVVLRPGDWTEGMDFQKGAWEVP